MPDETNENTQQPDEAVVEVSEQELADLGDFLAQVQIVLIGHEQRIDVLEAATFDSTQPEQGDDDAGLPDEGDSGKSDGSDEVAGQDESASSSDTETTDSGEPSDL